MYFLSQTILLREETLNKLELIQEFKEKCQLTKQESSEVGEMFFLKWSMPLLKVKGSIIRQIKNIGGILNINKNTVIFVQRLNMRCQRTNNHYYPQQLQ